MPVPLSPLQVSPANIATRKISSLRNLQPAAFVSSWQQQAKDNTGKSSSSSSSNNNNSWTAAAAALAGASTMIGAGTLAAACDNSAPAPKFDSKKCKKNIVDPQTFPTPDEEDEDVIVATSASSTTAAIEPPSAPSGLKDPMTIYARMAYKQALKEQQRNDKQDDQEATAQATSPTEDRKNRQLDEQKTIIQQDPLAPMTPEEMKIEEATRKAKQHSGGLKLFSGNGNMALSLEICRYLGINLGKATVGKFADGECNVVVHENVRGKDCYIIQPTCPPVNDNIMELLLMVSTLRRASARRITVVIPYYGYARQDRKMQVRHIFRSMLLAQRIRILLTFH